MISEEAYNKKRKSHNIEEWPFTNYRGIDKNFEIMMKMMQTIGEKINNTLNEIKKMKEHKDYRGR